MQCLQLTRGEPPATTIAVTITGSGNYSYCYALINGTRYSNAATGLEVQSGDVISFKFVGGDRDGSVVIDGITVATTSSKYGKIYDWTVPSGISFATIDLYYNASYLQGIITVTTS